MNSSIQLVMKTPPKNLVVVTGLSRSGKSMLAPIVASLERSENLKMNYTLEQFPVLNQLGLISDHVAAYLMRYTVNFIIYDSMIGRNSNFRFSDWTSIWNSSDPRKYFKRLMSEEGDVVFDKIEKKNHLNVFMFHNALWHAEIFFHAFPELKMIHIERHPIDVIHSWFRRGYGSNFYAKDRSAIALISNSNNNSNSPYHAFGWEEEYNELAEMDRIIRMINFIQGKHQETYSSLSKEKRDRIMTVNFERIVTNPNPVVGKICEFLETRETLHTSVVLKKQKCPRTVSDQEKQMKYETIAHLATPECSALLETMINDYEAKMMEY